jgi:predicted dehydrogenase
MVPSSRRAAIAGCGVNGAGRGTREGADLWFTHAGAYLRHPGVELVAVADPSPERRELCRRVWGVEHAYASVEELLRAERVDLLSVCTPDEEHTAVTLAAIEAGVPAIFCEKPLAATSSDGARMVEAARARGTVLAVNHHRRWEAGHRDVRAMIARGDLGRPLAVTALFAGGLRRVGTHAIDLLRYFFGGVDGVTSASMSDGGLVHVRLPLTGGASATVIAWPKTDPDAFDLFELDIIGTRGRVRLADFGASIHHWRVAPSDEYGGDPELAREFSIVTSDMRTAFVNGVDAILAACATGGDVASSGADALEALRLLEAIEHAGRVTVAGV